MAADGAVAQLVIENYGPIGLLILYLWRRLNKLETNIKSRQKEQGKEIQKNAQKIQENRWQIKAIGESGTIDNDTRKRASRPE